MFDLFDLYYKVCYCIRLFVSLKVYSNGTSGAPLRSPGAGDVAYYTINNIYIYIYIYIYVYIYTHIMLLHYYIYIYIYQMSGRIAYAPIFGARAVSLCFYLLTPSG